MNPLHFEELRKGLAGFAAIQAQFGQAWSAPPDSNGQTPLHHAVRARNMEAVATLLHEGIDPTVRDKEGKTAFELGAVPSFPDAFASPLVDQGIQLEQQQQQQSRFRAAAECYFLALLQCPTTPSIWALYAQACLKDLEENDTDPVTDDFPPKLLPLHSTVRSAVVAARVALFFDPRNVEATNVLRRGRQLCEQAIRRSFDGPLQCEWWDFIQAVGWEQARMFPPNTEPKTHLRRKLTLLHKRYSDAKLRTFFGILSALQDLFHTYFYATHHSLSLRNSCLAAEFYAISGLEACRSSVLSAKTEELARLAERESRYAPLDVLFNLLLGPDAKRQHRDRSSLPSPADQGCQAAPAGPSQDTGRFDPRARQELIEEAERERSKKSELSRKSRGKATGKKISSPSPSSSSSESPTSNSEAGWEDSTLSPVSGGPPSRPMSKYTMADAASRHISNRACDKARNEGPPPAPPANDEDGEEMILQRKRWGKQPQKDFTAAPISADDSEVDSDVAVVPCVASPASPPCPSSPSLSASDGSAQVPAQRLTSTNNVFLRDLVSQQMDTTCAMELIALRRDGFAEDDLTLDALALDLVKVFRALPCALQSKESLRQMLQLPMAVCPFDQSHKMPREMLLGHLQNAHGIFCNASQANELVTNSSVIVSGRLRFISRQKAVVKDIRLVGCRPDEKAFLSKKLFSEGGRFVIETARNLKSAVDRDLVKIKLKRDNDKLGAEKQDDDAASEVPSSREASDQAGALTNASEDLADSHTNDLFGEVENVFDSSYRRNHVVCILDRNVQFIKPDLRDRFLVFSPLDSKYNLLAVPLVAFADQEVSRISKLLIDQPDQSVFTQYYYVLRVLSPEELSDSVIRLERKQPELAQRQIRLAACVKYFDDVVAINSSTTPDVLDRMYQMSQQLTLYDNDIVWAFRDFADDSNCQQESQQMRKQFILPSLMLRDRSDFRNLDCFSVAENHYDHVIDHVFSVAPSPQGGVRVGIHVSDVSAWATRNGCLDQAAKQRFCTLYFPNASNVREFNLNTSMLPWLQNDCSLTPGCDRLSISLFVDVYEQDGKPVVQYDQTSHFTRSVIRSRYHMTISEAEELLGSAPKICAASLSSAREAIGSLPFSPKEALHAMKLVADILDRQLAACGGFHVSFDEFDRLPNPASPDSDPVCKVTNTLVEAFEAYVGRYLMGCAAARSADSPIPFVVQDAPLPSEIADWCQANNVAFSLTPGGCEPSPDESLKQLKLKDPVKYVLLCKKISAVSKVSTLEVVEHNPARLMRFPQRSHYVYFCSPLHRYWDIAAHRLIIESVSKRDQELGRSDDVMKLKQFYEMLRQWEDSQSCQRSLDLSSMAFQMLDHPHWGAGIVAQIKETGMQLTHCDLPSMLTVPWNWVVGHCGTEFPSNGAVNSVEMSCRCVDAYNSGLTRVERTEFTEEVAGRLEKDGVLSMIRKWKERRYVGQELRVLFSGRFIKGKWVVLTQVIGTETKDKCRKPSRTPTTVTELAHYTCTCHCHPSASNVFFDANDRGFPNLRPPLPRDFTDRKHLADCYTPLLQLELVQKSILKEVDKNEENKSYWSQLVVIGRVVKKTEEAVLEFEYNDDTLNAFHAVRHYSLACIRGLEKGMLVNSHAHVVDREIPRPTDEKLPIVITLNQPILNSEGTSVAVEFNLSIPVVESIFSMMSDFEANSPPNSMEHLLLKPSQMALDAFNRFPEGASTWDRVSATTASYDLNPEQIRALERACKQKVSIIQGPPGTGKTKTAVSLAYTWAFDSSQQGKKKAVLYLGPSNQSVYVAAQALLKLPDVGTTSNPRKVQVTVSVRVGKVAKDDFPGSWTYEAEHHPEFRVPIIKARVEVERNRRDLEAMQEHAKTDRSEAVRKNITSAKRKLAVSSGHLRNLLEEARARVLSQTHIFLCTLSKWGILLVRGMPNAMQELQPKQIIVDEAAQATEPETFLGLAYQKYSNRTSHKTYLQTGSHLEHIVLVGDHMQLRPVVSNGLQSSQARHPVLIRDLASGLDQSLFARIALNPDVRRSKAFTMLTTQYRMHRSICVWPSMAFYQNRLRTDQSVQDRTHPLPPGLFPTISPSSKFGVVAVHVEGKERHSVNTNGAVSGLGSSYCNAKEAHRVIQIVEFIDAFLANRNSRYTPSTGIPTVAIITPYGAQLSLISQMLKRCSFRYLKDDRFPSVGTVSAFQGGEADFVICSWVRSSVNSGVVSDGSHIGFLCDTAQINVAMTRARHGLVLVGNFKLLPVFHAFRSFRTFADRCGTLVNDPNWPYQTSFELPKEISKFVSRVLAGQVTVDEIGLSATSLPESRQTWSSASTSCLGASRTGHSLNGRTVLSDSDPQWADDPLDTATLPPSPSPILTPTPAPVVPTGNSAALQTRHFLNCRTVLGDSDSDSHWTDSPLGAATMSPTPTPAPVPVLPNRVTTSPSAKPQPRPLGEAGRSIRGEANTTESTRALATWENSSKGGLAMYMRQPSRPAMTYTHRPDGTVVGNNGQASAQTLPVWHHPSTFAELVRKFSPPPNASPKQLTMATVLETLLGPDEYNRLFPPTEFRLRIVRFDYTIDFSEKNIAWVFGLDEVLFTKGAADLLHWVLYVWYQKRSQAAWGKALQNSECTLLTWQLAFEELNNYPETTRNPEWNNVRNTIRIAFGPMLDSVCNLRDEQNERKTNEGVKSIQQDTIRLCSSVVGCSLKFGCPHLHVSDRKILEDSHRRLSENATRPLLLRRPLLFPAVPLPASIEDARRFLQEEVKRKCPNSTPQLPWSRAEDGQQREQPQPELDSGSGSLFRAVYQGMLGVKFAETPRDEGGNALDPKVAQREDMEARSLRQICYDFLEGVRSQENISDISAATSAFRTLLGVRGLIPKLEALLTRPEAIAARDAAQLEILALAIKLNIHIYVQYEDRTIFEYRDPEAFNQSMPISIRLQCNAMGRYKLMR